MIATALRTRHTTHGRTLRVMFLGETISACGTQLSVVGVPWLVLQLTDSPLAMGLVMAAKMLGITVFGVASTTLVGRLGPRRVMLISDGTRAVLVAMIPALYFAGHLGLASLIALSFLLGAFFAPYTASQQSILPSITGEDEKLLISASATLQTATRLSATLGPMLAGMLIALFGAPTVLVIDSASFLIAALLLAWCLPEPTRSPGHRALPTKSALRNLRSDRLVGCWSLGLAFAETAWQGLFTLIPLVALSQHSPSSRVAGGLMAAFGAGSLAGTLLVKPVLEYADGKTLALTGRIVLALAFSILPFSSNLTAIFTILILIGILNGLSSAPIISLRILRIPAAMRTEILTMATAISLLGGASGWALSGFVAQQSGIKTTFAMLAVLQIFAAALFFWGAHSDTYKIEEK